MNNFYMRTEVDNGEIRQTMNRMSANIQAEIINTKDSQVRAALISLGWTPPKRDKYWYEFWRRL